MANLETNEIIKEPYWKGLGSPLRWMRSIAGWHAHVQQNLSLLTRCCSWACDAMQNSGSSVLMGERTT
jgi:hypothetical protein